MIEIGDKVKLFSKHYSMWSDDCTVIDIFQRGGGKFPRECTIRDNKDKAVATFSEKDLRLVEKKKLEVGDAVTTIVKSWPGEYTIININNFANPYELYHDDNKCKGSFSRDQLSFVRRPEDHTVKEIELEVGDVVTTYFSGWPGEYTVSHILDPIKDRSSRYCICNAKEGEGTFERHQLNFVGRAPKTPKKKEQFYVVDKEDDYFYTTCFSSEEKAMEYVNNLEINSENILILKVVKRVKAISKTVRFIEEIKDV